MSKIFLIEIDLPKDFIKPKTYFDEQKYFKTRQEYNALSFYLWLQNDFALSNALVQYISIVLDGFNLSKSFMTGLNYKN